MKNLGLQPTSKTSSSRSDEDAFLEDGNFNLEETNEDLAAKSNSFRRQLNMSLHLMVG